MAGLGNDGGTAPATELADAKPTKKKTKIIEPLEPVAPVQSEDPIPDEAMNPTATGAAIVTSAADARIELIARTLAETSIKRLFRLLNKTLETLEGTMTTASETEVNVLGKLV